MSGKWPREMVAIGKHCCRSFLFFAMDPEDRHLRGNSSYMYRQLFFTCTFHGPPSGIQVSLTHSLTHFENFVYTFTDFFFSSLLFPAFSLPPGLFYWSVSRLPGLLRSGLEGGWHRWRGEVLRRAPSCL